MLETCHTRGNGGLALRPDIDRARRIVADQHDRKPGHAPGCGDKGGDSVGNPAAQTGSKSLAVDHLRGGLNRHHAMPFA